MRSILLFALLVIAGGVMAARYADRAVVDRPTPHAASVQAQAGEAPPPDSDGRSLTLAADRQGHFNVEARLAGQSLGFIVDTGASLVALRESDAASVGIHPMPSDYTVRVNTANGEIKAAPAQLDRLELGDIAVEHVAALVLPDDALSTNLLGVSFLSRLKRYEYANGRLVLEQ
jgi:aspartyl protease family protein